MRISEPEVVSVKQHQVIRARSNECRTQMRSAKQRDTNITYTNTNTNANTASGQGQMSAVRT